MAQAVAVVLIISLNNTVLYSFVDLISIGAISLGIFAITLTFFAIGVINSINMIAGLDGLAGSFSLISFISFAILSYANYQFNLMYLSLSLIGVVSGFFL